MLPLVGTSKCRGEMRGQDGAFNHAKSCHVDERAALDRNLTLQHFSWQPCIHGTHALICPRPHPRKSCAGSLFVSHAPLRCAKRGATATGNPRPDPREFTNLRARSCSCSKRTAVLGPRALAELLIHCHSVPAVLRNRGPAGLSYLDQAHCGVTVVAPGRR